MDQVVHLWDLPAGRERQQVKVPLPPFGPIDASPDGTVLAGTVPGGTNAVALVELAAGKELHRLTGHGERPRGTAFSPDGRTFVAWCEDRTAYVWDVATGRKLRRLNLARPGDPHPADGNPGKFVATLSPDGRLVAYGGPDGQHTYLAVQELATGRVVRVVDELPDRVESLAFAPDGRSLAWAGAHDRAVHLVELASGRQRHSFGGHKGVVRSLTFFAEGRALVSGSEDTTALVWDLADPLGEAVTARDLEAAWDDLAAEDAGRAYRALRRLAAAPDAAVPYLGKHLRPVPVVDDQRLARLIADLDSDTFAVREQAAGELGRLGDAAAGSCRKALEGRPSAEARRRLEQLLEQEARGRWSPSSERLRALRALEALELAGGEGARRLLGELAGGMPGAWLTEEARAALERRARRPGGTP
jgi:sugar lactone lactonase YvrE